VKYKDLLVLDQLRQAGADLTVPRHVLHYLYFAEGFAAEAAAAQAAAHGFETATTEPEPAAGVEAWSVRCERHDHTLSMDDVRDTTDFFEDLAARFGGSYDGWEASAN
jgi:hypothetical protein